ncbi:hypothetical protein [Sneathiella sp. HT1-7]|uniref:hypothetical protein n=1 Tax=Sneathiella sp. HT1-7 TaxID=2887192 RepID=UPI001D147623|nr:hypothetical protein [Sneathiella sp. HT1-7]MCC3304784.1 hypothetical protein [Sneathiella sp. HT1-7]
MNNIFNLLIVFSLLSGLMLAGCSFDGPSGDPQNDDRRDGGDVTNDTPDDGVGGEDTTGTQGGLDEDGNPT